MANNVFRMRQSGQESSDCTAPYSIRLLKKDVTVREFIAQVLEAKDEWGYITVTGADGEKEQIEYRYSRIIHGEDSMKKYMERAITGAKASGGWTRMDYILNAAD